MKPGLKFSGLVSSGKVVVPPNAVPSNKFDHVTDTPSDQLIEGREYMIPLSQLVDSPYQVRLVMDPARVDAVGDQLEGQGQLDAIEFRLGKVKGTYELIKGHTRKHGALSRGWTELRGLFRNLSDQEAEAACMVDNTGEPPTEYEYAHMFKRAISNGHAKTQEGVGKMFGCSQGTVAKRLGMLELAEPVQQILNERPGLFGAKAASVIRDLWTAHPDHHEPILETISMLKDGMDQGDIRKVVEGKIADRKRKEAKATPGQELQAKPQARREIIKSTTGSEAYVTILKEKSMTIEFKDLGIPPAEAQETVNKALRELAERHGAGNKGS